MRTLGAPTADAVLNRKWHRFARNNATAVLLEHGYSVPTHRFCLIYIVSFGDFHRPSVTQCCFVTWMKFVVHFQWPLAGDNWIGLWTGHMLTTQHAEAVGLSPGLLWKRELATVQSNKKHRKPTKTIEHISKTVKKTSNTIKNHHSNHLSNHLSKHFSNLAKNRNKNMKGQTAWSNPRWLWPSLQEHGRRPQYWPTFLHNSKRSGRLHWIFSRKWANRPFATNLCLVTSF